MHKVMLVVLSMVVVLAGACANPADDKPEARVTESEPLDASDVGAMAEGVPLELSEESTIAFVGSKVTGSHNGGFNDFEGTITLVDGDPTASRVEVFIDATSLWSDNDRLTGHLKSPDFFDVETYPTARFTSTAITATADGGYEITGNLELHGVTKQITFPANIEIDGERVTATAEFVIKRFDFGIQFPGKPDDLIRDEVVIRLDLTAGA